MKYGLLTINIKFGKVEFFIYIFSYLENFIFLWKHEKIWGFFY